MVGPICESGDVLGEGRLLPESAEGDVLLLANAGAYGRVMASAYNRRPPAEEVFLEPKATRRPRLGKSSAASGTRGAVR